jgi:hypothetical protein
LLYDGDTIYAGPNLAELSCYERNKYYAVIDLIVWNALSGDDDLYSLYQAPFCVVSTTLPTDMTMRLENRVYAYKHGVDVENPAAINLQTISHVMTSN